jgi:hypothetical protein
LRYLQKPDLTISVTVFVYRHHSFLPIQLQLPGRKGVQERSGNTPVIFHHGSVFVTPRRRSGNLIFASTGFSNMLLPRQPDKLDRGHFFLDQKRTIAY